MHTGKLIKDIFDVVKEAEKSATAPPPHQTPPMLNDEARQERVVSPSEPAASRAK
jgi:hypothetical protein